jgi:DNA-binding MarR family transcriptional regulator
MDTFIENALKEEGLKEIVPSYRNIITVLFDHDGKLAMNEVGRLIGKDKSTVTALVNKLIQLDYVKKEKCLEDRRKTYIILTKKSKTLQEKFESVADGVYHTAYNNFSEEEKDTFLKLLKKLNNNFDE